MISFIVSVIVLILGYYIYGSYLERVFGSDGAAVTLANRLAQGRVKSGFGNVDTDKKMLVHDFGGKSRAEYNETLIPEQRPPQ